MNLEACDLFCVAYESYLSLHAMPRISFEHAGFLLSALQRQDELRLHACAQCGGLALVDVLAKAGWACKACEDPVVTRRRPAIDSSGLPPTQKDWSPTLSIR